MTAKVTSMSLRVCGGGYIIGNQATPPSGAFVERCYVANHGVTLSVNNPGGWGVTNNIPIAGQMVLDLIFS